MIAHAASSGWADEVAESLSRLPVALRWSRTVDEALGLAATGDLHVGVVDAGLPVDGGLGFVRRLRRLGLDLPCLLVCEDPNPGALRDALGLEVYSVLEAGRCRHTVTEMVVKIGRQFYNLQWPDPETCN